MKEIKRYHRELVTSLTIVTILCLSSLTALALEDMTATIRVSNGAMYDYVIIGEHPLASDGFDKAYDTISPRNLNSDMGLPYISAVVMQPEWKPALRELRGDIRAPARKQRWQIRVNSSLDKRMPGPAARAARPPGCWRRGRPPL